MKRRPLQRGSGLDVIRTPTVGFVPERSYLQTHIGGASQSIRRTLTWAASTNVVVAAATYSEIYVVKLNSPYDPDNALGGTSATGFAKYMAFYSKCFVLGARIKAKGVNDNGGGAASTAPSASGINITTNTTSLGSVQTAIQTGLCDYGMVFENPDRYSYTLGIDVGKFVDKPDVLDDPQFFCTSGADPSQLVVGHVWVHNLDGARTLTTSVVVEVEFDCVFTDPIPFT